MSTSGTHFRKRHGTDGGLTRTTHGSIGFNPIVTSGVYGSVIDYGSAGGANDSGEPTGQIPGNDIIDGTLPPGTFDPTPPEIPTGLNLTSDIVAGNDGGFVVRVIATLTHPTDTDYFGSWIEITKDNDGAETPAPVWTQPLKVLLGKESTSVAIEGVAGNTTYWGRAYAQDVQGNNSAYSSVDSVVTALDLEAPSQPSGFSVLGGFRGAACKWLASGASDLAFYELRVKKESSSTWDPTAQVKTSTVWVTGLEPDVVYDFQVRAVDTSGNTVTSTGDATPVNYLTFGEAGWTATVKATPSQVGQADIAARSITTEMIDAGGISADVLTSGKIVIKTTGATTALEVKVGDAVVGSWDADNGIKIFGADPNDYAIFDDAYLRFYRDDALKAEIGPDGILADSLRTGTLAGAHNVVKNSSFEMAAFVTGSNSFTFTDFNQWTAAKRTVAPTNLTDGAAITKLTPDGLTF